MADRLLASAVSFTPTFKYYKSRQPPPDLSTVITVAAGNEHVQLLDRPHGYGEQFLGIVPANEWEIYSIKNKPGLLFIKNPFTPNGQRYWISRCLADFSRKPNKLNIDIQNCLEDGEHWWEVCNADPGRADLLNKLRWSTLGYHHNWDTKIYSESSKCEFPADLACLCNYLASVTGFESFVAQAAIVNYYHMNSTLSGHTDHSENNLEAPLFSISFGQSAIFLIGGLTQHDPALPILLESGDIVIMSRDSRLCYHAVPRILPALTEPWNERVDNRATERNCEVLVKCQDERFWQPFDSYIKTARLNVNVRQVLRTGQCTLDNE